MRSGILGRIQRAKDDSREFKVDFTDDGSLSHDTRRVSKNSLINPKNFRQFMQIYSKAHLHTFSIKLAKQKLQWNYAMR